MILPNYHFGGPSAPKSIQLDPICILFRIYQSICDCLSSPRTDRVIVVDCKQITRTWDQPSAVLRLTAKVESDRIHLHYLLLLGLPLF